MRMHSRLTMIPSVYCEVIAVMLHSPLTLPSSLPHLAPASTAVVHEDDEYDENDRDDGG